ncbi:hypothetical protein P9112_014182 [Eukaryota sp. TZLM1-RC]
MKLNTFILALSFIFIALAKESYFWVINDLHSQWTYQPGTSIKSGCMTGTGVAGKYGDFHCNTPETLTRSALQFMSSYHIKADFTIFGGDVWPHELILSKLNVNKTVLLQAMANFTNLYNLYFPTTPMIPMFGNHDNIEPHQWGNDNAWLFNAMAKLWKAYIPSDQVQTFKNGGYYKVDLNPKFSFLVLNSGCYFSFDDSSVKQKDPLGQFQWLTSQIKSLRNQKKTAIIITHVAPGQHGQLLYPQMLENHQSKLLKILYDAGDVIKGYINGHEHSDSIKLIETSDGGYIPVFVCPSILSEGGPDLAYFGNNPAVRLFKYDKSSGKLLDYQQFWFDLEKANLKKTPVWSLEYRAGALFGINDLSPKSMEIAFKKLVNDDKTWDLYWEYLNVRVAKPKLGERSKRNHLCSIKYLKMFDYLACCSGKREL